MIKRKYTNVRVINDVYVNSDQTYYFTIQCDIWGKRTYNDSCLIFQIGYGFENLNEAPRYLVRAVMEKILERLEAPDTEFYEKDRDGWKRYKDFRYHDAESLARQIDYIKAWLQ